MDRYRRLGMEYRFHDDAGEPADLSLNGKKTGNAADTGDEEGAVADEERREKSIDPDTF